MFIERTYYFAKPGKAAEVLEIRREACRVRVAIGLKAGIVHVRAPHADASQPDVTWEAQFDSREEHEADLEARAHSPAFEACRARQRDALARFERYFFALTPTELVNGMADTSLRGHAIAPREMSFLSGAATLKGYLHLPPGPGPFPCLITNHGSTVAQGSLDVSRPGVAAQLMSWGVASFLPHRRGYGNSPGKPWREEVSAAPGTSDYDRQLAARLDAESDDILAALDFVAGLPEIRANHIGAMGSSFGGVTTLLAAAKSDRFRCAVEFAGAAMNWEKAPSLRETMLAAARSATPPIFFIQAENDYSAAPTRALSEARRAAGKEVRTMLYPPFGTNEEEGHLLERTGPTVWAADVRRFLERFL
jgi:dienelactone hydrolase